MLYVLHGICTRLCLGHLNMHVGNSLWHSQEIVKNLELCLSIRWLLWQGCPTLHNCWAECWPENSQRRESDWPLPKLSYIAAFVRASGIDVLLNNNEKQVSLTTDNCVLTVLCILSLVHAPCLNRRARVCLRPGKGWFSYSNLVLLLLLSLVLFVLGVGCLFCFVFLCLVLFLIN